MRARFREQRDLFDLKRTGRGGIAVVRSRHKPTVRSTCGEADDDGCFAPRSDITYKLAGPLAQFGRPVVVANVVDRLLGDFAKNLAQAATGGTVTASAPIGGIRLLFGTLFEIVHRIFSRK